MNIEQWQKVGFPPMQWSIYKDESVDYDDLELDLSAPVPDGEYSVKTTRGDRVVKGVLVKDGQFVPYETSRAIYRALTGWEDGQPKIADDHLFIEELEWIPEQDYFEVFLGS